jgi:hypothetical protein
VEHARDEQSCLRKLSDTSPVILEESGRVSTLGEHPGIKLTFNFQFMTNNVPTPPNNVHKTTKLQNFSETFLTEILWTEHAGSCKSETKNNIQKLEIQMPQVCANIG